MLVKVSPHTCMRAHYTWQKLDDSSSQDLSRAILLLNWTSGACCTNMPPLSSHSHCPSLSCHSRCLQPWTLHSSGYRTSTHTHTHNCTSKGHAENSELWLTLSPALQYSCCSAAIIPLEKQGSDVTSHRHDTLHCWFKGTGMVHCSSISSMIVLVCASWILAGISNVHHECFSLAF